MSKKTAFVHIGHPKTASSYIQFFFALNHALLAEHSGLFYPVDFVEFGLHNEMQLAGIERPSMGNAYPLLAALLAKDADKYRAILDRISESEKDLFLSSEGLFYLLPELEALTESLARRSYEVRVICFVPDIFHGAASAYLQNVKNHLYPHGFHEFVLNPPNPLMLQFKTVTETVKKMVGVADVQMIPYIKDAAERRTNPRSIVHQTLSMTGRTIPPEKFLWPDTANRSLSAEFYWLVLMMNRVCSHEEIERFSLGVLERKIGPGTDPYKFLFTNSAISLVDQVYGRGFLDFAREFDGLAQPDVMERWLEKPVAEGGASLDSNLVKSLITDSPLASLVPGRAMGGASIGMNRVKSLIASLLPGRKTVRSEFV